MRRTLLMVLLCCCAALAVTPALAEGSWGQINQELARPEGWQRIVSDSPFALGESRTLSTAGGVTLNEAAYGTYPSIDGSTVSVPMAMEFARQHLPLTEGDLPGFVLFSTTHAAYEHLIGKKPNAGVQVYSQNAVMDEAHPVDLFIGTEPSDEELAMAEAAGVTLVKEPVCYDAFVFITHRSNPVESLTVEQIRGIYSGEITNWKEVGGEDIQIMAFQREKNAGSQTAMENLVMKGMPLAPAPTELVPREMGGLVEDVATYRADSTSIGYTYLFYINTLYKNDQIKALRVNDVAPTPENLRSGAYPLTAQYFGVIRQGEEEQTCGRFLAWMQTEEGQRCIRQAGYVTLEAMP